ncbi:Na+ dependent nucleoside transporter C-terminus-domain-containing protein [Phascolomyces articulosus]|uniref:Na+ dependent nucleoside transporter C-terminus-domain-containing protein n=1 Tax=Phascolomyces articulosus TaxID=60185 RepID=A0AAD5KA86_9FUNG|nr:Na+ dependent nucleoside transporter C-terminus-domain-containing protein [Phascolomyces articulosus]
MSANAPENGAIPPPQQHEASIHNASGFESSDHVVTTVKMEENHHPYASSVDDKKQNNLMMNQNHIDSQPFDEDEKLGAEEYEPEEGKKKKKFNYSEFYGRHRRWFHLAMFLIFTGYLAAAFALQVPKGYNQENLVLGLIYAFVTLYLLFQHVPISLVVNPFLATVGFLGKPIMKLRRRIRNMLYFGGVLIIIIVVVFAMPETENANRVQRLIGFVGLLFFLGGTFASSKNHRKINWNTVAGGILLQFVLGLFVFKTSAGHDLFQWIAVFAEGFLSKAWHGTSFVFGEDVANSGMFFMSVVPVVIFFAAVVQMLYYVNALPWILSHAARIFIRVLGVSGAEAVVAVGSCFLGQTEAPLLVRPVIATMTKAEIHQVMTCGFATISGSVLFAYISMGVSGQALITSSIMSIPCSLAISKLRYPETEEPVTRKDAAVERDTESYNLLHAASTGAGLGMTIALLIVANLIAILALLYSVNAFLTWLGNFLTIQNLTLEFITGYLFVPLAWFIGADTQDLVPVGRLMALKIWANEFVAYNEMQTVYLETLTYRSRLISTYALCGFANFSSIGIQLGGLGAIAPKRTGEIAEMAISALICGSICTWVSACFAGMLL